MLGWAGASSRSTSTGTSRRDDRGERVRLREAAARDRRPPRSIPGTDGVVYFRTLDDYRAVRARMQEGASVVVIGGGFIGSEIAASLAANGCQVTMVFPEPGSAGASFPAELSAFVTEEYRGRGVEVLTGETVAAAGAMWVTTGSGRTIEADVIVAGLGIEPDTELAAAAGLAVDNGIVVDEYGRAGGHDDVFAAGDVASFPVAALGRRSGSSTRIMRSHMVAPSGRTWPERTSRTTICRSSTPTCSSSDTRRSARSTRGSTRSSAGRSRTARASSRTSTRAPAARIPVLERVGPGRRRA